MAYDEDLANRIRELLAAQKGIEEKRMFGGLTFMVAGHMCCGVLKDDLIVRIEPSDFETLVAQPHVRPFDFTGRTMQGMVYVESSALADAGVLRTWVHRGTDYVAAHSGTIKRRKGEG